MPKNKKTKKELLQDKLLFLENLGKTYSKRLKNNATTWESTLFNTLSDLHYKFKFQVPHIVNKDKNPQLFILDFLLTDYNIIIEVDSIKHHTSSKDVKNDNKRTRFLRKEGFHIIRLFNRQINTLTKDQINQIIQTRISLLDNSK